MRFLEAIKNVILYLLFGYIIVLLILRLLDMNSHYGTAIEKKNLYQKKLDACKNDTTYHTFQDECKQARVESEKWPIGLAFKETLKNTYSCIQYPCSDILKEFMQSWILILTLSALLFFTILIMLIYVYNRTRIQTYSNGNFAPISYELNKQTPFLIKND